MPGRTLLAALLVLSFALAACDDNKPTEVPPPPEKGDQITETFSGSFGQLQTSSHGFTVSGLNNTEVTITALAPVETLTVGLGVGSTEDGGVTCAMFAQDNSVRLGETLLVADLINGEYCVAIYDVGNVFPDQTVDYTLSVLHP